MRHFFLVERIGKRYLKIISFNLFILVKEHLLADVPKGPRHCTKGKSKHDWHKKDVVLLGLEKDSSLYHVLDKEGTAVPLPEDGILVSERLALLLNVRVGSTVTLESPLSKDKEDSKTVVIKGVIAQYLGLNAYMNIDSVQGLLEQGPLATSAIVSIEEKAIPALQAKYNNSKGINGIDNKLERLRQSQELMASSYSMILIMAVLGIITGFAIIYNSAIITLSERSRELASMMVLGMTPQEVHGVITFEQWFLSVFGMLFGIPLTKLMVAGLAESVSNDVYSMPALVDANSLVLAFFITIGSIWIAQQVAARKIKKLSLVEVLKSRE